EVSQMGEIFQAVDGAHEGFSTTLHAAGDTIIGAASADWEAAIAAMATALGAIGAPYIAAHVPALGNCVGKTFEVGHLCHGIADATTAHKAATVACDNA